MLYITSPERIYFVTKSLFPSINISPFPLPLTATGNHYSILSFYEIDFYQFRS
jgi:hypothetical protein